MNRNGNETESFAGNFVASGKKRLFFEVPHCHFLAKASSDPGAGPSRPGR